MVVKAHAFDVGDYVVYPKHGVGRVIELQEQEIAGMKLELYVLRFEKQKQSMTIEMNRLRELLHGQNEMIDGCLDEMKDERRAARQASDSTKQLKVIASDRMDKIKWWKGKCDELTRIKDAYMTQANKIDDMQQRIDEYERLSKEMTEDYEETILSMCPRHIEKARVRNLTNKYGH